MPKSKVQQKHVPIRTCIATGEKKPKKDLLRLVLTADGSIIVDIKGKVRGRGANISPTLEAFDLAVKKNAIGRALKLEKKLDIEVLNKLRQDFSAAVEEKTFRPGNKPVTIRVTKSNA